MVNDEKYFCYNPFENEFVTFETRDEAEQYAYDLIEDYRSAGEEWPMEIDYIYTGVIEKRSVMFLVEDEEDKNDDGNWNVEMREWE